jgi:hypothetical protein
MNELAQNGQGTFAGEVMGVSDGIADTKTETEMLSDDDFHWKRFRFTL